MDPETQKRIEELQASIKAASDRLEPGIPQDEWNSLKASVKDDAEKIETLLAVERQRAQEKDLADIKAFIQDNGGKARSASKAANISFSNPDDVEARQPDGDGAFLKALYEARKEGNQEAWAYLKATVGDTSANGGYMLPNNFVSSVIEIATARNIYRQLLTVVDGVRGNAVDIPYELADSSLLRAIGQGGEVTSFGSNKDTRDFTLASATATLFPIARIIDVGSQLLRRSSGAAEKLVRSKLARVFALAESHYILNGTGASNQPKGIITSIAAASSSYTTAYSSGVRADSIATALGALEGRNYFATAVVLNPADYWQVVTDTQGTSGSGGYAVSPTGGASMDARDPSSGVSLWGVALRRDPQMTAGTAILGEWSAAQLFTGDDYRVDVSDEAGNRFDRNLVGFRAEEEIAFNADPYVLTGMFQRITGL